MQTMKILVVGGGIAGLSLSIFLQNKGFKDITLVEKEKDWANLGFGVNIWGIGRKMLRELGIDKDLEKGAYFVPASINSRSNKELAEINFKHFEKYGGHNFIISRDLFHKLLIKKLNGCKVLMETSLNKVENIENSVRVTFSDGKIEGFDLVIGADGINSQVRDLVFGKGKVDHSGWTIKLAYLPQNYNYPKEAYYLTEKRNNILFFPMKHSCFFGFSEYKSRHRKKDFVDVSLFSDYLNSIGWNDDQIKKMSNMKKIKTNIAFVKEREWFKGRVVLIGDAKHAMSPITGMGCSMAMEDAFVLSEELSKNESLETSLKKFAKRRGKRIWLARNIEKINSFFLMVKTNNGFRIRDFLRTVLPLESIDNLILHRFFSQKI